MYQNEYVAPTYDYPYWISPVNVPGSRGGTIYNSERIPSDLDYSHYVVGGRNYYTTVPRDTASAILAGIFGIIVVILLLLIAGAFIYKSSVVYIPPDSGLTLETALNSRT